MLKQIFTGLLFFNTSLLAMGDFGSCSFSSRAASEADAKERVKLSSGAKELLAVSPADCAQLLDTAPRGLACLHCLASEAEAQADAVVQILLESCLKRPAINYLVDDSFGFNPEVLKRHIEVLSSGGRSPTFVFYFANGPSQRKFPRSLLSGFGSDRTVESFRRELTQAEEGELPTEFSRLVKRAAPSLLLAQARGARLVLVPMLEDNLDKSSFLALAKLLKKNLPAELEYELARNPCPTCYRGSDSFIPEGFLEESHDLKRSKSFTEGILTNDGDWSELEQGFQQGKAPLSVSELQKAIKDSEEKQHIFLLWSAARQGLYYDSKRQVQRLAARERNYAFPSQTERSQILELLSSTRNLKSNDTVLKNQIKK